MPRRNRGPELRFREDRGAYYIYWSERGRSQRKSTNSSDPREAEVALGEFIRRRAALGGPREPAGFPVIEALADYLEERAPQTASPETIYYMVKALEKFWEGRTVAEITRETCRAYCTQRAKAPGTLRRELGTLRAAVNHALREGRMTLAPTVFLPPKPKGRDRWLTRDEVAELLRWARRDKRCRLHLPLFILIGLYTGARKEAILSLRWPQVDLERGRIDFNPPGRRETSKGRPVIPIPRRLRTFLRLARRRGNELGFVVNRDGQRVKDIKRGFASAAAGGGLEGVTPHTLRHTSGTWMAQRGVRLFEIAGYLGHSHERTTELYAHHHPDYLKSALGAFD